MIPLYGASRCEVFVHRQLIEAWITTLSEAGNGNVEDWLKVMRDQFGESASGYLPLGRALWLAWCLYYQMVPGQPGQ